MVGAEEGSGAGGDAGLHHREGGQENYEGGGGWKGTKRGGGWWSDSKFQQSFPVVSTSIYQSILIVLPYATPLFSM